MLSLSILTTFSIASIASPESPKQADRKATDEKSGGDGFLDGLWNRRTNEIPSFGTQALFATSINRAQFAAIIRSRLSSPDLTQQAP
jgi:hypothetical protein